LKNHGIDTNLFKKAEETVKAVFERSEEEKLKFAAKRVGSINQGISC
jgi:isopenicillin N synthase-like dioxygenase